MSATSPFRILIIGAGRSGAMADTPGDPQRLSHGHAFSTSPDFELVGFADPDLARAQTAAQRWGGQAFASLDEAFAQAEIDGVAVAVPDARQMAVLEDLLAYPLQFVCCEKPLGLHPDQATELTTLYRELGIPLLVNATRRFVPEFMQLRTEIRDGHYGRFLSGTGVYGKGLCHYGSHMIDLLRDWFDVVEILRPLARIQDYSEEDPSVSVMLEADGGLFWLQAVDHRMYTVFEADLFFERGRIRMLNNGTQLAISQSIPTPAGMQLGPETLLQTQLSHGLSYMADHLAAHLKQGIPLRCTAQDALDTLHLCHQAQYPVMAFPRIHHRRSRHQNVS